MSDSPATPPETTATPARAARRSWHDADTALVFAVLVAACGMLILAKVLNPENWVYLPEPPAVTTEPTCPPRQT
jgi:hypothetical protein